MNCGIKLLKKIALFVAFGGGACYTEASTGDHYEHHGKIERSDWDGAVCVGRGQCHFGALITFSFWQPTEGGVQWRFPTRVFA